MDSDQKGEPPVGGRADLTNRLPNDLTAGGLADQLEKLEQAGGQGATDETLLLLNRVVHAAVTSLVVTDPNLPDNPIVYHNPAFENVTGYRHDEIIGHNCRFLQGQDTERAVVEQLRAAIEEGRSFHGTLLNYRKDGTPFWNELNVAPVHDEAGILTHFVGVQNDVTRRADAEREREALLVQQQRIADALQQALLITPFATGINGLEIATQYLPAWDEARIGGDFFDTVALGENRVALIVGDCTGKGIEAGKYTAEAKYALRVLLREDARPDTALKRLNSFFLDTQRLDARAENALVCVVLAVMDTNTGETAFAAAGMEPPLIIRADGRAEAIETHGLILGVDAAAEFPVAVATLNQNDVLLLVTDGVTEARGPRPQRAFFGYDGLIAAASNSLLQLRTLTDMGEQIVEAVKAFAEDGKAQDDVCLLLASRCASK